MKTDKVTNALTDLATEVASLRANVEALEAKLDAMGKDMRWVANAQPVKFHQSDYTSGRFPTG